MYVRSIFPNFSSIFLTQLSVYIFYLWHSQYYLKRSLMSILSRIGVTVDGVWIGEWIYWPLIHTTRNYKHYKLIYTLYKLLEHQLSLFPACCVAVSPSLATTSNNGDSSASRAQVHSSHPPVQNWTKLIAPTVLVITSRHGTHRKHFFYYCVRIHCRGNVFIEPLF
jgi:hypothetical protein